MSRLRELREKRMRLATEARAILDACEKDKRGMNAEEQSAFGQLHTEIETVKVEIEAQERQAQLEAELIEPARPELRSVAGVGGPSADPRENAELERRAFSDWMRNGLAGMSPENRALLRPAESRALGTLNTAGGYTVPSATRALIVEGMKQFGGIRRSRASILTTADGAPLTFPMNNDTGNTGALLAEGSAATEQDTTFGAVTLDAYTYTSKIIRVQNQLLQDSAVDVEAYVRKILTERLGRATESAYAIGDGSSKPRGITVAAANSSQTIDISDAVITVATLNGVYHSIDPAYREVSQWMMHDNIMKLISALSFSSSMPWGIWRPSLREGEPDTILGKPYIINNSMPDGTTATDRSLVFGDLSHYHVRDVQDIAMARLVERYAEYNQTAFVGFFRTDGDLIDPGTNPVKYAAMVA